MREILLLIVGLIMGILGLLSGNYVIAFIGVGIMWRMVDRLKEEVDEE